MLIKGKAERISANDQAAIQELLNLFTQVDEKARAFQQLTQIRCPDHCARCCINNRIETTALELLPLAAQLWSSNRADFWLKKISQAKDSGGCVFFKADPLLPGNGSCRVYALRPLICRLFGFFTIKDKYGRYVYGSCKVIKQAYPQRYRLAQAAIARGTHPWSMTDFSIRVLGANHVLGREMIPINTAAKIALEKIGFNLCTDK